MSGNRFDELAADWDVAPIHLERTRDVANRLAERIDLAGLDALEIGAGTGLLSFALCDVLGSVVASDPSQGMVAVLQGKIRQSGCANISALRSGDDLAGVDGPFDIAMLQMALHHVPDPRVFLARVFPKLRPAGVLAIADLDTEDGSFHGPTVTDVHHGFDRIELESWMREAGFDQVSFETVHTMRKGAQGDVRGYPIFLALARRPA